MHPRATVEQALANARLGFTARKNAEICGVPVSTLRKWRYGARRRQEPQPRKHDCPRCFGRELDEQAYAYLLGLYLGDGHIVASTKGCFRLSISCGSGWPGLIEATAEAMGAVMPLSKVGRRQRIGCVDVHSQSKHWPCLFPQHGPGPKHARRIALIAWQTEIVTRFPHGFIRGLIHSDGCRSMNRVRRRLKDGDRWYEYPRYTFCSASSDIQRLFTESLDALSISWTQMNRRNISVAKREAVAGLDEFVGPKY